RNIAQSRPGGGIGEGEVGGLEIRDWRLETGDWRLPQMSRCRCTRIDAGILQEETSASIRVHLRQKPDLYSPISNLRSPQWLSVVRRSPPAAHDRSLPTPLITRR